MSERATERKREIVTAKKERDRKRGRERERGLIKKRDRQFR